MVLFKTSEGTSPSENRAVYRAPASDATSRPRKDR